MKHPKEVARFTELMLRDTAYKQPAISTALLHDIAEDGGIYVFDPFNPPPARTNPDCLNILLDEAGREGEWACYGVHRLTRRGGTYLDYMLSLFSLGRGVKHFLDSVALAVKIGDRTSNSNPQEELEMKGVIKEYSSLDEASLERFYKRHNIYHFSGKGRPDIPELEDALRKAFRRRKVANAIDNLVNYLPRAEMLLVGMGLTDGHFDLEKALRDPVFNYEGMRHVFGQCYERSLVTWSSLFTHGSKDIFSFDMAGANRGNEVLYYKSVLAEIEENDAHDDPAQLSQQ